MTDELVTRHVAELLARERARLDAGIPGAPIRAYDVISGASGIGRYLLLHPRHHTLLRHLLAYLVRLTAPVAAHGVTVPGWWVSTVPNPARPHDFPCGRLNLGLAHGICGPMTLLAFARQAGIRVPGDDEAIASIAEELLTYQDERGQWPGTVALEDIVLDGENDPVEPGLCHGRAGALHLTSVLAHDTGDARLVAQLPRLAERVLDLPTPEHPFRFARENTSSRPRLGFLDGAAGIALALHRYADGPQRTIWEAALMVC
ncbi:lanthionine synthetase-like protein [Saccharopolyspora erythraea NRRL 2338]|uniref:Lanthionine synthetase C-like n=2 Tax=Saccharopolyspora erythraea TaxID=1836 RepID=A4FJJ9_SACEN|nr:lanthionine synthetase [Saccharopolyspora erythraea D]PFG97878.1 lanthionine synthetase-like protein [Saccharopolyspora erythraea NRRL 2338]CAM04224.1 lanthionine synthetase C-like [Saccharopolyspora erythraea NRRL 2338]